MNKVSTHRDLDVWKKSIDFTTSIYKISKKFPDDEKYGLANQIRRAAVSIPSNIAEGAARQSNKEFIQFLYVALGSSTELETQLIISKKLDYLNDGEFEDLNEKLNNISKMLLGLIRYQKSK